VKATHEHEWEAAPGLPEALPADEKIIWQGAPRWDALAVHAFHVRKLACYFGLMLFWQLLSLHNDGADWIDLVIELTRSVALVSVALCLLCMVAWWSASTTMYTLTNKRLVMRVGIVLSLTFNFPLRCIRSAHVKDLGRDMADIALQLPPGDRIGWFHLWPHQRAWHLKHPQPTLRCVDHAEQFSALLHRTWAQAQTPAVGVVSQPDPDRANEHGWQGLVA
jgi:Bacterial PH domain